MEVILLDKIAHLGGLGEKLQLKAVSLVTICSHKVKL